MGSYILGFYVQNFQPVCSLSLGSYTRVLLYNKFNSNVPVIAEKTQGHQVFTLDATLNSLQY